MLSKIRIWIVVLLCGIMATIGIYSYRSTYNYKETTGWVNHSQQVIAEANSLLSGVQDIEMAQRGYVITGERQYLSPYTSGMENITNRYNLLKNLVQDNPVQEALLDSINKIIVIKQKFVEKVIDARSESGFEAGQNLVASAEGEILTQELKTRIHGFIQNERDLLSRRLNDAAKEYTLAVIFIIISVIVTILIILSAYYFLTKDSHRRIATEARLRESELLTKKFLDNIPLGVFILDKEGKPYYANDKSSEMLGKCILPGAKQEDLTGNIVLAGTNQPYPPERLPLVRALRGKTSHVEDVVIVKGNTRTPVRINAAPVTNSEGKIEYAIATFEDITDIREAHNKIRESEEKFYKAFAISPVAFAISDIETGNYIEVNDSFARMTGYSREEMLGKSALEMGIVDTKSREKVVQALGEHGTVRNVEISIHNKNGRLIDILTSAEILVLKGKKCILSINYDITTLKESLQAVIAGKDAGTKKNG